MSRESNTTAFTVGRALRQASAELAALSPSARLDAELLVMHVCRLDRAGLITHHREPLSAEQRARFDGLLARRRLGEPMAYLTGWREFRSLTFRVSPATLIPRPETELLVERALIRLPPDAAWTVADLGTGCGAVAASLAKERPRLRVVATDISPAALAVARANARALETSNVEFLEGRWCAPLAGEMYEMLLANPPYVPAHDPHLREGDVRFEPAAALVAGRDGLDAIRAIAAEARDYLKPGGWLLLEHGFDQGESVRALLRREGYRETAGYRDLAGHERVAEARRL
jgi:release factor glutamine methyltransferase